MARQIHSEAGSSQLPEREPLLGSDDDNSDVAKKTYASVDIRAVTLLDDEDPPTECVPGMDDDSWGRGFDIASESLPSKIRMLDEERPHAKSMSDEVGTIVTRVVVPFQCIREGMEGS